MESASTKMKPQPNGRHAPETNPYMYPKSKLPFDSALFANPTSEYRGSPFWSWNCKLNAETLLKQIDDLESMGMGGFHMHSRVGLDTPYMGKEFMEMVRLCVDKAKSNKLLAGLYDEDRWPSGSAGGLVTRDRKDYRMAYLLMTPNEYGTTGPAPVELRYKAIGARTEGGVLLAQYAITNRPNSNVSYRKSCTDDVLAPNETRWYLYHETAPDNEWYNGASYVDSLNPDAIADFIQNTHEKYYIELSGEFGKTVPSIFTDEPQFGHKQRVIRSEELKDYTIPFSGDLLSTFSSEYGYELLDFFPEVLWDAEHASGRPVRYHYHDHVAERFVTAFPDQISQWCRSKGIALTGHMMGEGELSSITESVGDVMRCYRSFDIPGIDMLCDRFEYNTAKQASSVQRQNNGNSGGLLSELYGVTGWTFSFAGHKSHGDWQAALGVTLRIHHLAPVSIAGEGKRDYPAAISYQSPWYKEYKYIEDHFARVATTLTRGTAHTRVAVIHPIESFWLCYGPLDRYGIENAYREDAHKDLTDWLLHGMIDFDFICESLLPSQTSLGDICSKKFPVGLAKYDVIVVSNLRTIRSTTLERLRKFEKLGGVVLVAGTQPDLVDGIPQTSSPTFGTPIQFTRYHLLFALEPYRDIQIYDKSDGTMPSSLLYQMRNDGAHRYLFVCNEERKEEMSTTVSLTGFWTVQVMDTFTGSQWDLRVASKEGRTVFDWHFEAAGSFLMRLVACEGAESGRGESQKVFRTSYKNQGYLEVDTVSLSEPNVLLLDRAVYAYGDKSDWQPVTEILRIDNAARDTFGLPPKLEALRQPWCTPASARTTKSQLHLQYEFVSIAAVAGPIWLAVENPETMAFTFDGSGITNVRVSWWVDNDISTILLVAEGATLAPGKHWLDVSLDFGIMTNLERIYVLGDFGVELRGTHATITGPLNLNSITFGDWTRQGLPFYAGNVTYRCIIDATGDDMSLEIPRIDGPVVTVVVDGDISTKQTVAFFPYVAYLGSLSKGKHTIDLTCFGNRESSFGPLHLIEGKTKWISPNVWRSETDWWREDYTIVPMGIAMNPIVKVPGQDKLLVGRRKRV